MRDDLLDDLDAFIAEIDYSWSDDEEPPPPEDPDGANRLLRHIRRLERECEEIDDVANKEILRIRRWRDDRVDGIERSIAFFARSVEAWARANDRSTVKLPNGTVTLRPARTSVIPYDEDSALLALDGSPLEQAVTRTKVEIAKSEALKWLYPGTLIDQKTAVRVGAPPDGREYREALAVVTIDVEPTTPLFVPRAARLPGVIMSCPTRKSFAYKTLRPEPQPQEGTPDE